MGLPKTSKSPWRSFDDHNEILSVLRNYAVFLYHKNLGGSPLRTVLIGLHIQVHLYSNPSAHVLNPSACAPNPKNGYKLFSICIAYTTSHDAPFHRLCDISSLHYEFSCALEKFLVTSKASGTLPIGWDDHMILKSWIHHMIPGNKLEIC
jgi:hypothetical protein